MFTEKTVALERGCVQVYTGDCKGKTTAALGLAFRAMGRGLKTYIGQFIKCFHCGELDAAKLVSQYITIEQYGKDDFSQSRSSMLEDELRLAQQGLIRCKQKMLSCEFDIVVFDEIITAHYFHLVSEEDMLNIIAQKPINVEVVFTGMYAPPWVIEVADLVTEMKEVKHYYRNGVIARDGIEY